MRIGLVATLLFIPALASADTVTLYFSGEFTGTDSDPANLWESVGVFPGKKIWGSFEYDTTTTNADLLPDADIYEYSDFTVNGLGGNFTPAGSIAAIAGSPDDYWQLIGGCDLVPGCGIALAGGGDLGIQNTDPAAPGYVGDSLGHPIFVPDPSSINVGSIAYATVLPESGFVISIFGFSVETSPEPPVDHIVSILVDEVVALNISNGLSNSLDSKLDAALKAVNDVNDNNDIAAINSLRAFINAVEAQRGGKIAEDDACGLIRAADSIIVLLGGVSSGSTCLTQP